jgi:hypothetical protein
LNKFDIKDIIQITEGSLINYNIGTSNSTEYFNKNKYKENEKDKDRDKDKLNIGDNIFINDMGFS